MIEMTPAEYNRFPNVLFCQEKKKRSTMFRLNYLLMSFALVTAACSGSKELTPESARTMVQERLDTQGEVLELPYGHVQELISEPSYLDYTDDTVAVDQTGEALRRLNKAGFVSRSVNEISRLNVSGEYDGTWTKCYNMHLNLRVGSYLVLGGSYEAESQGCWPGPRRGEVFSGTISGELSPDNAMNIWFTPSLPGGWDRAQLTASHDGNVGGQGDLKLSGQTVRGHGGWPLHLEGGDPTLRLSIKEYRYGFEPSFVALVRPESGTLNAGRIIIDGVENLLLVNEATAEAELKWKADLNEAGRAIATDDEAVGTGRALFRKQPDGVWVLTEYDLDRQGL